MGIAVSIPSEIRSVSIRKRNPHRTIERREQQHVSIPSEIRSVSMKWGRMQFLTAAYRLNPFGNQVSFDGSTGFHGNGKIFLGLNPFGNQVSFDGCR